MLLRIKMVNNVDYYLKMVNHFKEKDFGLTSMEIHLKVNGYLVTNLKALSKLNKDMKYKANIYLQRGHLMVNAN
jgi:hypothetical protein